MGTIEHHPTTHAVSRFRERVRPALAWEHAEREFKAILALAEQTTHAPVWLAERQRQRADQYLVLGDLVMPLAPSTVAPGRWLVTTCLTRGGISDLAREARNNRRRRHQRHNGRQRDQAIRLGRRQRQRAFTS